MANSSSAEESDNSYSSNHNNNNNHNNYNNSESDARGSGSDSEDEKPLASRLNTTNDRSDSENENNGNGYGSESQSQDVSSQSIKRERSDSEGNDSDDEPLSKKLAKQTTKEVKKEVKSQSEDEYSPTPKKNKTKTKTKVKKESKPSKRKKDSDYDSEYDSDEDYKKSKKKKKSKDYSDDDEDYKDSKKKKSKSDKKDKTKKIDKDSKSKVKKEVTSSPEKSPKKKVKKEENEEHIWKWWEEERPGEGIKWKTLSHKGPVFPPPYEPLPKNVKFYYDGKSMKLNPEAEEVAGFYARMLEHDYVTKEVFNKNFMKDWKKTMTADEKNTILDLKKCNFGQIAEFYKEQTEKRKQMTKEEKQKIKKQNEEQIEEYGYCIVDGHKQKIGNFKIEPPGLFRGRGEHPKMGKLKKRVRPEDVIINIGKKAEVPAPPPGHKWKEVRHDNTVTWLASWTENIMNSVKYIMLNPSSKLKSIKDWQKYEKARELKKYVDKIRVDYRADFKHREMVRRQRAVALYFIDKLALRAGNEKEEGETADTVGCCSLRVEHIKLHEQKNGEEYVVDFDFLGKDSIRYENSVAVEKRVFKNLKHFMENKNKSDDLFDRIDTADLNRYLSSLMEGLTAKVFRTYNASQTLQDQLNKLTESDMSMPEKLLAYNRANRAVAVLCNHQRAVPKTFDKQMENMEAKIKEKKKQVKEAKKAYKDGKGTRDQDKLKKKLANLEDQLKKLEVQRTDKEENKQIALGTSKLNYLDPRITVAWCKKYGVDIAKVYNKTQRDKFRWAIEMVGPEYQF